MNEHKRCTKCDRLQPLVCFNKNRSRSDGLSAHCRECRRRYYQDNKSDINKKCRDYHRKHKTAINKRTREYHRNNREENRKRNAKYVRTLTGFTKKVWNTLNLRTTNGKYRDDKHPHNAYYINKGIRLELTEQQLGDIVKDNWQKIKQMWADGETPSIDRIDSDGHYSADNVRFITMSENIAKSNRERSKAEQDTQTAL